MVVMILENAPMKLRGELTRWMIEPRAGVFVGRLSAMVRDRLWAKTVKEMAERGCIQIYSTNTEQGYAIRASGDTTRKIVDLDGLQLVSTFNPTFKVKESQSMDKDIVGT